MATSRTAVTRSPIRATILIPGAGSVNVPSRSKSRCIRESGADPPSRARPDAAFRTSLASGRSGTVDSLRRPRVPDADRWRTVADLRGARPPGPRYESMAEADLYEPIKRFLEAQGYEVKGEIGACDIVAVRSDEGPVVVELKERLSVSDTVYVAFRVGKGHSASWRSRTRQVTSLLRRLGLGLLTVSARDRVVPVLDPAPYRPRSNVARQRRLLKEFAERVGDPEVGGSASRRRLTAYRQDALRCARELDLQGVLKLSVIREQADVSRAGAILRDNHYGWFERVKTGYYELSPKGREELVEWSEALEHLVNATTTQ